MMALCGASAQETVLVGDSVIDWRTTVAAATRACLVRYGFGWETIPTEELETERVWVIDQPTELLRYL